MNFQIIAVLIFKTCKIVNQNQNEITIFFLQKEQNSSHIPLPIPTQMH